MSVVQGRSGCRGILVESAPGVGECELGEDCEALSVRSDYLAYRNAHIRIVAEWRTGKT